MMIPARGVFDGDNVGWAHRVKQRSLAVAPAASDHQVPEERQSGLLRQGSRTITTYLNHDILNMVIRSWDRGLGCDTFLSASSPSRNNLAVSHNHGRYHFVRLGVS
jgi:hypothetical protein